MLNSIQLLLVTPLVDGYHRGGGQAAARALPCVSPHSGAREELPQAYVVSDLSASHSALPWFWAGIALVLSGCCLALGRVDTSSSCVVTA